MLKRFLAMLAVVSALTFAVVGAFIFRGQWCATDHWYWSHWSPATRTYSQVEIVFDGGLFVHTTRAVVPSTADATPLAADAGPSHWTLVHDGGPPCRDAKPTFWADRYRSCPSRGGRELTMAVMADLRTVECSDLFLLVVTGVAPVVWVVVLINRARRRRQLGRAGFPVVQLGLEA